MSASEKKERKAESITRLQGLLSSGDTIYTILRHVSASGMSRTIAMYAVKDGRLIRLTGLAAFAMDRTFDAKRDGIKIAGCGMDMGFSLVYDLASTLFSGDRAGYELKHDWL